MTDAPTAALIAEARAPLTRKEWQEITAVAQESYRLWSRRATQDARAEDQYEWHLAEAIQRAYSERLLRLANALEAAAQWRPIETAPRDGARVLCFAPGNKEALPQDQRPVVRVDWVGGGNWRNMRPQNPYTHWLPLPSPPQEAGE